MKEYEEFKEWFGKNLALAVDEHNKQFREGVDELVKEGRILTGHGALGEKHG